MKTTELENEHGDSPFSFLLFNKVDLYPTTWQVFKKFCTWKHFGRERRVGFVIKKEKGLKLSLENIT